MRWNRLRRKLASWLRALARRVDVRPPQPVLPPRFRVLVVMGNHTHTEYQGEDGARARRTWEAMVADSAIHGRLRFYDGEDCRGEVVR